jgi:HlyD family secretion protein
MKTVVGIVVLGLVVGGIYLLNDLTRTKDGKSRLHVAGEPEVLVETARPERREIVRTVQAPGEVEAFAEVDISSEVVGKIIEMPVEEGDDVRAGDLLCRLDDADYRARVLSREANVAKLTALILQADAELDKAQRDYDHEKDLIEADATSAMAVANYRTALIGAQVQLESRRQELIEAEAALQSAQEELAKTVIKAPISGRVSQRFAKQGEVVITGTMNNLGTRIMVISDLSKMQVRCRIDEADAPLVAPEQVARIYLQSDTRRSIPGRVMRVGTKGTKPTGRDVVTFETLVLITGEDDRVKPGMTANVEVEVARKDNALTIPVQAVVYRKRRDLPEALLRQYDERQQQLDPAARPNLAAYIKLVFCVEPEGGLGSPQGSAGVAPANGVGDPPAGSVALAPTSAPAAGRMCARPYLVQTGINDATSVEITEGIMLADAVVVGPYRSLDQLKDGSPVKREEKVKAAAPAGEPTPPSTETATTTAPASSPADDQTQDEK